jgi:hypothetical protein
MALAEAFAPRSASVDILNAPMLLEQAALTSGVAIPGARDNNCPLYVTSLRQRLRHFLAKPSTELYLNKVKVETAGSDALYACMDEHIERELGGIVKYDAINIDM